MPGVEKLNPYKAGAKAPQVEAMFDHIASAYDRMNSLMTLGMHVRWRIRALNELRRAVGDTDGSLLDVATGTGDVAIHLRRLFPRAFVTGIDLSQGMMDVARGKVARLQLQGMDFRQADCLALPFADGTFEAVTVAYGVRNFADLEKGYREMLRVLRPGGRLCVIELCEPRNLPMRLGYRLYTRTLVPLMGRVLSGDRSAYSYLPRSVAACPQRHDMTAIMRRAGFADAAYKVLPPSAIAIYTAKKPE